MASPRSTRTRAAATAGLHSSSPASVAAGGSSWTDQVIPLAEGRTLQARVYGRRVGGGPTPLVLHFHGGAFIGGTLESGALVAGLLVQAGAIVVSVAYPLAPAHPFPQAAEDGHAALTWLHRNRRRLGGEGAVVLVAGEEAGGNLAAGVCLMARDRLQPPLAGQILLSPMLDPCLGTASVRGAETLVNECCWSSGWSSYLPRVADACHPYAAPGICLRLMQIPPSLLVTARDDPLRDEAEVYAARLRTAGVAVEQVVLDGTTDWPRSLMQGTGDAGWIEPLRQHLQRFLTARQSAAGPRKGADGG